jgi:hypothetical protein
MFHGAETQNFGGFRAYYKGLPVRRPAGMDQMGVYFKGLTTTKGC